MDQRSRRLLAVLPALMLCACGSGGMTGDASTADAEDGAVGPSERPADSADSPSDRIVDAGESIDVDATADDGPEIADAEFDATGDSPSAADLSVDALGANGCPLGQFRQDDSCISRVISVAAAQNRTCAVLDEGSVWCWGGSAFLSRPERVPGVANARSVAIGGSWGPYSYGVACVVTADQRVLCWGEDYLGALGDGSAGFPPQNEPAKPVVDASSNPITGVKAIALGDTSGCATTSSSILCWGDNSYGQLGVPQGGPGEMIYSNTQPTQRYRPFAAPVPDVPAGVVGAGWQVGLSADASARACGWGGNSAGRRYWPVTSGNYGPNCAEVEAVTQIVSGINGACFLYQSGDVACWGYDLGVTDLPGGRADIGRATQIASGAQHVCALEASGRVYCWGYTRDGQVGVRPMDNYLLTAPQELKDLGTDVVGIGSGVSANHTCAILRDGSLKCWGRNREGQLGNSTAGDDPVGPVLVRW
jgi:alpha-tubulin suppressor-like RCC1 family protein